MTVERFFVPSSLKKSQKQLLIKKFQRHFSCRQFLNIQAEVCYHVICRPSLFVSEKSKLEWLLSGGFADTGSLNEQIFRVATLSSTDDQSEVFVEVGPRLTFTTAFSTNVVAACRSAGIENVDRIEKSIRYLITFKGQKFSKQERDRLVDLLHDRMTECEYSENVSFDARHSREHYVHIDILSAPDNSYLWEANRELGLSFDKWDIDYYGDLFRKKIGRNPTDVELFDLAQSNSEHSRHWFFKGKLFINDAEMAESLFQIIMKTLEFSNQNNIIKFCDNSSGIQGFEQNLLTVNRCTDGLTEFLSVPAFRHLIYTAETHNFPTGVCPFPGAATGTGGRIRDIQAAGRGAHVVAGLAGYSFGNLHLDDYELSWEKSTLRYPGNFACPRDILIQASNGASDYGNKFGEPVLAGFSRSFGNCFGTNNRIEWIKPIMFSGGIGSIDDYLIQKRKPEKGHITRNKELDFGAVQRGDPEMEQKMNRALRTCVEMGENNPILSIHDQGAGGNGNVLKEIVEGAGAIIYADAFDLGDPTLSVKELWGAEYQESNAILIRPESANLIKSICHRERCPVSFVGTITGDNREFHLYTEPKSLQPVNLPESLSLEKALNLVLRLPSVASKRFLTNKVDRSVTGLVAQQQCVGPLHTPLADVAVIALSYFDKTGGAVAIGEQPIKGLVDSRVGARMSVGEALTNLVFAPITCLKDVKCSANWMWPAKLAGEGAELVAACISMCSVMRQLGIAVDGGKDSLRDHP